jgi:thymidylate synthase (FAD)
MTTPNVQLKSHTPLWVAPDAIRTCWQSYGKSDTINTNDCIGPNDRDLVDRIGNKFKHASTLEHLTYYFKINDISRACLQELARHRMASYSIKSSRYTLKELKDEDHFLNSCCITTDTVADADWHNNGLERAQDYLVFTGHDSVDLASVLALDNLRDILLSGEANDKAKFCMPESYKTEVAMTINARSLQNFLSLRSSSSALWEIQNLAQAMFDALPPEHKYLFEHCVSE